MKCNHKIDFFIKIGGSLMSDKEGFGNLTNFILDLRHPFRVVVTIGSGRLPRQVLHTLRNTFDISPRAGHEAVLLARDCVATCLADQSEFFQLVDDFADVDWLLERAIIPVLRQSKLLRSLNLFTDDNTLTATSVSCLLSNLVSARKFVVLTDVDGIYAEHDIGNEYKLLREISTRDLTILGRTCVDETLPFVLEKFHADCWVLNGTKLDNLRSFFYNDEGAYTRIYSQCQSQAPRLRSSVLSNDSRRVPHDS